MGIPSADVLITDKVSNTAAEAAAVADLLKKRKNGVDQPRILLVTSAFHMRRSMLLFKRAGLDVIPFRVDFQVSERRKLTILAFMPWGDSLRQTERALRELYGYWFTQ